MISVEPISWLVLHAMCTCVKQERRDATWQSQQVAQRHHGAQDYFVVTNNRVKLTSSLKEMSGILTNHWGKMCASLVSASNKSLFLFRCNVRSIFHWCEIFWETKVCLHMSKVAVDSYFFGQNVVLEVCQKVSEKVSFIRQDNLWKLKYK